MTDNPDARPEHRPPEERDAEDGATERQDRPRPEQAEFEVDYAGLPPGSPEASGAVQIHSASSAQGRYTLQVRFGVLAEVGRATSVSEEIPQGSPVILRTSRGTEFGVSVGKPVPVNGDVGETVAHVLRVADAKDIEEQRRIEEEIEPEEKTFCRDKIHERSLKMKLSAVEHLFGNERLVFYFTSERRVDFRALVRDLAWHFRTRVELRQIGARDEAKLLADFEHCGQPLCCKVFLTNLEPVTMRMAKLQRTSLDPAKISGRCGRLMCCLRYEDEVYKELKKGLPKRGAKVVAEGQNAEVLSTDILTQRALVRTGTGDLLRVPVAELGRPEPGAPAAAAQSPSAPAQGDSKPASSGSGPGPQREARSGGSRGRDNNRDNRRDRQPRPQEKPKIVEARPQPEAAPAAPIPSTPPGDQGPQAVSPASPRNDARKRGSRRRRRGRRAGPSQSGGPSGAASS